MGKWLLAAVVAIFLLNVNCACEAKGRGAVELQTISVTLDPEHHALAGESTVTLAPGAKEVALRLADSAKVEYVEVNGKRVPFSFAGGLISVQSPPTSDRMLVTVSWSATFNDQVASHPGAGEDPSYGVNGAITREGTFLGDAALWYPVPPQVPLRRSISITAPAYTEAVTYGRRLSRETVGSVTTSVWEESRPVGALALCAGPYRIEEIRVNGIDVYTYLYPGNAALSPRYLEAAGRYLTFYSNLFGPYPFEKFAVVENFFPTGYGFPSFTLLGGTVIRLPFIVDTSLPHEIAHSWWGNGIEVDWREGNWCEGLVSYLADYYLKEHRSAAEGREYRRQLLIDYASLVTPANDFPLKEFTSRVDPSSRAIGYGKGAMLFHMIRSRIGDRAFFEALRQVCREQMYRSASWNDLIRAFSKSSGKDLAPFVDQWLTRKGGPRLTLADVSQRREAGKWIVSGSIVQAPPTFKLSVPLRLDTAGAAVNEAVEVSAERTRFSISGTEKPERLLLDPDAEIFRVLAPEEIPVTVNSIKGSTSVVGVMTRNCRAGRQTFADFLASVSQGRAPIVDEAELGAKGGAGRDLVFCGVPQQRALLPQLPDGVKISDSSFSVGGESFSAPDALLLLVLQREGARNLAAVFNPMSQAAAEQYAQKITHYGKYGYLAFARGANRVKGTLGASDGGVSVRLSR